MANIKGTQVKDLPLSDNIIGTDVLIKQNINTRQTQRFTAQTLLDHTRQELDIDTIEDNIEDLQTRTTNIEKKGLFGVWSADATYGLYAIVRKNNTYWISLQDNNTNHDPEELNSEWWELFQIGGGEGLGIGFIFPSITTPVGYFEDIPRVLPLDGREVNLSAYPDFKDYLIKLEQREPKVFASDYTSWQNIYNQTKFGHCPLFCWKDNTKQSVYLPAQGDFTGKGTRFTVQKQEVPTGTMTAMTLINYMQLDGAFTASGEDGYTGGNGFTEIRGRNFTYDPQKAGDNSFKANGTDNKIEANVGRWYIQVVAPKTQTPTLFDFKGSVSSVQDLPQASSNKSNIYLVDNATDGGLYLSDGSTWNLIMEPASIVNLTSLVNRVATLENSPHIIYHHYSSAPYYEVYSSGMCRQWGFEPGATPNSNYTTNTTIGFQIPYINTDYLLSFVGFNITNNGAQQVQKTTAGFTTTSISANSGTSSWESYGMVDLSTIEDNLVND